MSIKAEAIFWFRAAEMPQNGTHFGVKTQTKLKQEVMIIAKVKYSAQKSMCRALGSDFK